MVGADTCTGTNEHKPKYAYVHTNTNTYTYTYAFAYVLFLVRSKKRMMLSWDVIIGMKSGFGFVREMVVLVRRTGVVLGGWWF